MKRKRTISLKKLLTSSALVFCVALLLFGTVLAVFTESVSPQHVYAANNNAAADLDRRKLVTFLESLKVLNMGDLNKVSDLYYNGDYGQNGERFVVGLDREGTNGVARYDAVVKDGVSVLDSSAGNPDTWLLDKLTGHPNFNTGKLKINQNKLNALEQQVQDRINSIGTPSNALKAARLLPMVNVCYTVSASASKTGWDFQVPGVGFFYFKSEADIKTYIHDSLNITTNDGWGTDVNVALGDLQLGFQWGNGKDFTSNFDKGASNFYPVGDDFSPASDSKNGILDCNFVKGKNWIFDGAKIVNGKLVDSSGNTVVDPGAGSLPGAKDPHVDCETGGISFDLLNPVILADRAVSWILCPLLDGAQAIVNTVGGWVVDQLEFKVDDYLLSPAQGSGTFPVKDAWNTFRVVALSLVILVALAGILMSNFLDAYTLKKIFPRLLIAIIAISLSWDLVIVAIQVTNALGGGVRSLIDIPFQSLKPASINPLLILGAGAGAAGLTTILGALSFIGTAAIAVLFAFIFTILRTAAIIAMVIFAPVAILLWILPGTQKGWNFWREGLMGALLMFPIVTAFLSIGAAFGKIVYNIDSSSSVNQTIALVATYAPYFLIPKAFSMAGGVVGSLSGMVNDRSRGAFDRLKKFRQGQGEKRRHDIQGGQFFRGGKKHGLRQRVSGIAQGASLLPKAGLGKDVSMWKGKLDDARSVATQEHAQKSLQENAAKLARAKDDAIMKAKIASGGDLDEARDYLMSSNGTADLYGGGKDDEGNLHLPGTEAYEHNVAKNKGNLDAALRAIDGMNRGYDQEAGDLVAFKTLVRSSTAFSHENGFGEMAEFIRKVSTKPDGTVDTLLATQLLEEGNAAQNAAGRTDVGGGSFSVGIKAINNIGTQKVDGTTGKLVVDDAGAPVMYEATDATDDVLRSVSEGKSAQQTLASGKDKVGKAVSGFVYRESQRKRKAARVKMETEIADAGGDQAKIAQAEAKFKQETIRTAVWEQSYHIAAATSSADHAKAFGDKSAEAFDLTELPDDIRDQVSGKVTWQEAPDPVNPDKKIRVLAENPNYDPTAKLSHSEVWNRLRGTPEWQLYAKEYGISQAAANANAAAGAEVPPPVIDDPGAGATG